MELEKVLENIGMNVNESKIYLYLLSHRKSSQQKISDELGILRQTTYEVMNKMEAKGFISSALQGKRKIYFAVDPKVLGRQLEGRKEEFFQALPQLLNMRSESEEDIFSETFIGLRGLKNLFSLTLESDSEILWLFNGEAHKKIFEDYYWANYSKKRISKKIHIRLILEKEYEGTNWLTSKKNYRKTKINKDIKKIGQSAFVVFDNKIIIYSFSQERLFGVFIQNLVLKEMFKAIFEDYWTRGDKV